MLSKLMKYELIRKKNTLLTSLAMFVVVELLLIYTLYKGGNWIILFAIVSAFLIVGVYLFLMYDNIKLLSDDLNSKTGYMLFLTPNHGYNIVGAKMIVGFIEVVIGTVLLLLAFWINYIFANNVIGGEFHVFIKNIIDSLQLELSSVGIGFWHYIATIIGFILEWFCFIATVYLAIILRKTLFTGIRFKGLLSFLMFIALNVVANTVMQVVSLGAMTIGGFGDFLVGSTIEQVEPERILSFVNLMVGLSNGLNILFIIVFFMASGYLLTKKVDL